MVKQLQPLNLKLDFIVLNRVPLVQLPSCLSVIEAVALKVTFKQLLQNKPSQIVLDLSRTTSIDSSGVGALMSVLKTTEEQGIELILWSVNPRVKETLFLAGINSILKIEPATEAISLKSTPLKAQPLATHPSVKSWTKRAIDIIGALIGLLIVAVLFIPIALAIKLDSPGPILFSQTRCGLLGKSFQIWKFRSMVINAEELKSQVKNQIKGPMFKNRDDPRVTRVGRFLRRTSLDELPQFLNVLKGEMSLVGTRPPLGDEVENYTVFMWQRLNVKPGITGVWQTRGRSQISSFNEILDLDMYYQDKWSILYDMKLILKTLVVIFSRSSGAN